MYICVTKIRVRILPEQDLLLKSQTLGENLLSYCCQIMHMFYVLFILAYIRYCMILLYDHLIVINFSLIVISAETFHRYLFCSFNYNGSTDYLYYIF